MSIFSKIRFITVILLPISIHQSEHLLEKKEKKRKEKKEFCPAPAGSKLTDKLRNKQFL
jgi:hypothetical protein